MEKYTNLDLIRRRSWDERFISVVALRDTNFFISVEFQSIQFRGCVAWSFTVLLTQVSSLAAGETP